MANQPAAPKPTLPGSPIILPSSGKSVTIRKINGHDIIEARRVVADRDDNVQVGFATMAKKCLFNGVQAVYEDILALDEDDIAALTEAMGADKGKASGASTPRR